MYPPLKKYIFVSLSLGLTLLASSTQAQVPTLFATFGQQIQTSPFVFSTAGGSASLGLNSPIPVSFQFQTINGFGAAIGQSINATMTMSSISNGTVFTDTSFLVQPLKDIEIRFTSLGAAADSGDLLRVKLSTGNLLARPGGQTARLTGTEGGTGTAIVNFDSDYLDFSQPLANKNYSIAFTSVAPPIADGGNGFLAPFEASASGNFGSSPLPPPKNVIPEPATMALVTLGGLALARRRKRA